MLLTESILDGNRLALARLLTQVENDSAEGRSALAELFPHTGKAHLIGVTGAPGTGKSLPGAWSRRSARSLKTRSRPLGVGHGTPVPYTAHRGTAKRSFAGRLTLRKRASNAPVAG